MKINTVCIIDDDPICVYGTKVLLNRNSFFGADILVYEDGYEAIVNLTSLLKTEKKLPDVIFLDLNMPVMDGWGFLDELVKLPVKKKPHVVVVSSYFSGKDVKKGKSYGIVDDFISKPLVEEKLMNIFETIMTNSGNVVG
ncbi:response regulator [Maribacter thermophilus]|uniref:response regulator n=1 Tax=Maribacter thermophilus TaxID=1197874 RepID=UPI0006417B98|nr:response regulator [Maribacter thermophilus]